MALQIPTAYVARLVDQLTAESGHRKATTLGARAEILALEIGEQPSTSKTIAFETLRRRADNLSSKLWSLPLRPGTLNRDRNEAQALSEVLRGANEDRLRELLAGMSPHDPKAALGV